ncbi:related to B2-aldehyde-forming enzyme [Phialocephala subalpina]|uniref:Related to B2-aldehyde-forming enzyme n=1 Tax=Phialocephala subalpina TaxID=576137 RepID=A0A1L7WZM1_9HELO|nr:related to B2-aldehyde-forming enzyme [Phialocephala subalpina]
MATKTRIHETPAWEAPAPKKGLFSKFNLSKTTPADSKEVPLETSASETGTVKRTWSDKWLPHWLACMGRSRKSLFCSIAALVLLLLLILGLGLGLGLSHNSKKKAQNLPLPSDTGIFTGDLTYYSPGPGYGACGYENTSEDSICAVSHLLWDAVSTSSNPNNNPLCGKKIRITRYDSTKGGNSSVDVEVVDRCVGCLATDLDLSLKMFTSLAEEADGRVVGSWAWLN